MNLSKRTKVTRVASSAVAAQTAINGTILDMAGYDGVMFLALTGDVTATCVLTLKAQQDTDSAGATMADLTGNATFTAGATDADNKTLLLDLKQPRERYVRAVLTRTVANAVIDGIIAIQYQAAEMPPTHDTGVIASNLITAPAEA